MQRFALLIISQIKSLTENCVTQRAISDHIIPVLGNAIPVLGMKLKRG